jgi:hypothetical protein
MAEWRKILEAEDSDFGAIQGVVYTRLLGWKGPDVISNRHSLTIPLHIQKLEV